VQRLEIRESREVEKQGESAQKGASNAEDCPEKGRKGGIDGAGGAATVNVHANEKAQGGGPDKDCREMAARRESMGPRQWRMWM